MTELLVIIPAYNEEAGIASVIAGVRRVVPLADVLVVNDGSQDGTARAAKQAGARVLSHPYNMGYGSALQTGYKFATENGYRYLVQIDGDGQHDPVHIDDLLAPILAKTADVVVGSRFLIDNGYRSPFAKRVGMLLFGALASSVVGYHVTDPTSGYQALSRKAFTYCARDIFPSDFADADVLIMLSRAGLRTAEVAVRMHPSINKRSRYLNMYSFLTPLYYIYKVTLAVFVSMVRERGGADAVVDR